MIRAATADDADAIAEIYNYYIVETVITFEEEPLDGAVMAERIQQSIAAGFPWLVWVAADRQIAGYAYAGPWRTRAAYRFVAEAAIYMSPQFFGQGLGSKLYGRLTEDCRKMGLRALMGMVALPNEASARLHEKLGFRKAAHYPAVGWKFERWIDVGCWQLDLTDSAT